MEELTDVTTEQDFYNLCQKVREELGNTQKYRYQIIEGMRYLDEKSREDLNNRQNKVDELSVKVLDGKYSKEDIKTLLNENLIISILKGLSNESMYENLIFEEGFLDSSEGIEKVHRGVKSVHESGIIYVCLYLLKKENLNE